MDTSCKADPCTPDVDVVSSQHVAPSSSGVQGSALQLVSIGEPEISLIKPLVNLVASDFLHQATGSDIEPHLAGVPPPPAGLAVVVATSGTQVSSCDFKSKPCK